MMNNISKKTLLLIADISGYTQFMVSSSESLSHSQVIITDLLESILKEIDLPLEVSKLEGDAIFFYGIDNTKLRATANEKFILFFKAFYNKIYYLQSTNRCNCSACQNIQFLKLKLVVHYGEVLFHHVGKFEELSGPDVIIVHRLLKNSVQSNQYLLLSEAAQEFLEFNSEYDVVEKKENYHIVGDINTYVYDLTNESFIDTEERDDSYSKVTVMCVNFRKMIRGYINRIFLRGRK